MFHQVIICTIMTMWFAVACHMQRVANKSETKIQFFNMIVMACTTLTNSWHFSLCSIMNPYGSIGWDVGCKHDLEKSVISAGSI